jgi:protein TonB
MANIYAGGGGSRRTAVFVGIIGLHLLFYLALVSGLAREAMLIVQDIGIVDLPPPPPPPPDDLKEPPPPPPTDLPPPTVPPPLIDLPAFTGPTTAITAKVTDKPQAAPKVAAPPPRTVQITPPSMKSSPRSLANALNSCYPSASRRLNEEGRVVVTVTIGTDGKMVDTRVAQTSGFERLDGAAECVIRKLTFNPGKRDGQAVEAQASLPITFKLE